MNSEPTPLELAQKLISFNTMQPEGSEKACAEYISGLLEPLGYKCRLHEFEKDRSTLVAEIEGSGESLPICFAGHIDTVPLGTIPWRYDPFNGEVVGGRLYGRGITDMKAGIAAAVMAAMKTANLENRETGLKLICTAGEEHGCKGSLHLAEQPDALGEAGALVVPEPTSNHPVCCHRGAFWVEVSARGKTAHGAMPHLGDNAIYKVAEMIRRVEAFSFEIPDHPLLGPATLNVGMVSGGQNINSVPDRASFTIDFRTLPGQNHQEILKDLQETLGDEASIEARVDLPPVETDPEHPWMKDVRGIAERIQKTDLPPRAKLAFTDASALTPAFGHCPTVILGPGIQEMCHKTDEYCMVSKIDEAVEIYTAIIEDWCTE